MSKHTSFAAFAALAIGTKLWFRQTDAVAQKGSDKPVEAIKIDHETVLLVEAGFGWAIPHFQLKGVNPELLGGAAKNDRGFHLGWCLFDSEYHKLSIWTSNPTVKKTRVKKLRPSLTGQRFTIVTVPEGMEDQLKTGMKGTMVQTGSETPLVVLDGYTRTVYLHVSHLGIHKKRPKMTMDRLPPQTREVLSLLKSKGSLTAIEAGGVIRARSLPKRISELKEAGVAITAETKHDHTGQRYARYHLQLAA
jgi:hypothetical protein